jgi:hypothetical protein
MPDFNMRCRLSEPETLELIQQLAEMGLFVENLEKENKDKIFTFLFNFKFKDVAKDQKYQEWLDLRHRPRYKTDWTWRLDIENILWKINQLQEGLS